MERRKVLISHIKVDGHTLTNTYDCALQMGYEFISIGYPRRRHVAYDVPVTVPRQGGILPLCTEIYDTGLIQGLQNQINSLASTTSSSDDYRCRMSISHLASTTAQHRLWVTRCGSCPAGTTYGVYVRTLQALDWMVLSSGSQT